MHVVGTGIFHDFKIIARARGQLSVSHVRAKGAGEPVGCLSPVGVSHK